MNKKIFLFVKNIILIGMPNSGKTYLGDYLANELNYKLYDIDEYNKHNLPIQNTKKEWLQFRKNEYEIIKNIMNNKNENKIISTGGGCIEYPYTYNLLLNIDKTNDMIIHIIKSHELEKNNQTLSDNWQNLWLKRAKYYFLLSDLNYWNNIKYNSLIDEIKMYDNHKIILK